MGFWGFGVGEALVEKADRIVSDLRAGPSVGGLALDEEMEGTDVCLQGWLERLWWRRRIGLCLTCAQGRR